MLAQAEDAAKAALDGRIEEARQGFAKALEGTTNIRVLFLGFEFFNRIGDLAEAERLLRRWLAISGPDAETASTAHAYGNLGVILRTRGDLDGAEAMHRKALEIDEKLGRLEGMADDFGNLGIGLKVRGDLDGAEAMHRKSLEINEKLGRLEGMAIAYGNLGIVLKVSRRPDGAEAMHRKSLEINREARPTRRHGQRLREPGHRPEIPRRPGRGGSDAPQVARIMEKLSQLEGMAHDYGNLGVILQTRGDLDGAEAMHHKSLKLNEKLGRLEGMAIAFGNLGVVLKARRPGRCRGDAPQITRDQ